ncbi:MAG: polysaccharide deacetylase family protein [Gemmatimonadaceae bacterium]
MRVHLFVLAALLGTASTAGAQAPAPQKTLVERLGYPKDAKVLLINADDAGLNHAENLGTESVLKAGIVTSATVMVASPWFPEFAAFARANPTYDIGVHITLNSEWDAFRYGPILGRTAVPSLTDSSGYLWPSLPAFYSHATVADAEAEGRAQIQRAIAAGIDVSHLDMHMHILGLDARFFDAYLDLAKEFDLPVRFIPPSEELRRPQAARLRAAGIIFQDYVIVGADQAPGETLDTYWRRKLRQLSPGVVTELYIHVAYDDPELRAMTGDEPFRTGWRDRVEERKIFSDAAGLRQILDAEGVKLIHWKDLRALQRKERAAARR